MGSIRKSLWKLVKSVGSKTTDVSIAKKRDIIIETARNKKMISFQDEKMGKYQYVTSVTWQDTITQYLGRRKDIKKKGKQKGLVRLLILALLRSRYLKFPSFNKGLGGTQEGREHPR